MLRLTNDDYMKEIVSKRLAGKSSKFDYYGVSNSRLSTFPIYNKSANLSSSKHTNIDYDASKATHSNSTEFVTPKTNHRGAPNIHGLYNFNIDIGTYGSSKTSLCSTSEKGGACGEPLVPADIGRHYMNEVCGIPFNDIKIENFAAEGAGVVGITDKQLRDKNWRAEGALSSAASSSPAAAFMSSPAVAAIVSGGSAGTKVSPHTAPSSDAEQKEEEQSDEAEREEIVGVPAPEVKQAFPAAGTNGSSHAPPASDAKEVAVDRVQSEAIENDSVSDIETEVVGKSPINFVLNLFKDKPSTYKATPEEKTKINEFLAKLGYSDTIGTTVLVSSIMDKVRSIASQHIFGAAKTLRTPVRSSARLSRQTDITSWTGVKGKANKQDVVKSRDGSDDIRVDKGLGHSV